MGKIKINQNIQISKLCINKDTTVVQAVRATQCIYIVLTLYSTYKYLYTYMYLCYIAHDVHILYTK